MGWLRVRSSWQGCCSRLMEVVPSCQVIFTPAAALTCGGIVGKAAPSSESVTGCWGTLLPACPEVRCVRGVDVPMLAANRALRLEEREP